MTARDRIRVENYYNTFSDHFERQGISLLDSPAAKLSFLSDFLFPDLPRQQRVCFFFNAIYGCKFTASFLNISTNTVKFHVRQAKEKLRFLFPTHDPYDELIHRIMLLGLVV